MDTPWRIELLGRLQATQGDRVVTRFRARRTGALLAYLAYHLDRFHPRELLIEMLWPQFEVQTGRNNLSRELNSLRRQFEPPGVPPGAVIVAHRDAVRLNPAACSTDVQAFDAALQIATRARSGTERAARLTEAAELYQGELLPGFFEDWILPERERLAEAFLQAVGKLATHLEEAGDRHGAIQWARRAVAADPLREEGHHDLIRLLAAAGQPEAAQRQYRELERLLAKELGDPPAPETRVLIGDPDQRGDRDSDERAHGGRWGATGYELSPSLPGSVPSVSPSPRPPVASSLPVGIVTFLLAEINEGAAHEGCRNQLRPLLQAHSGYELQSAGEMLRAAFARASDALAAAVAAHKAVESERPGQVVNVASPSCSPTPDPRPLTPVSGASLRLALHTAEVPPDTQALHSPALQHATRLLLAAHPGQILLSEKSAVLLRDDLAPGFHLLDLGPFRLRDDALPEPLFQVCSPDLPAREFPPPNALPAHEGNLPLQFTRFFGREAEIARLRQTLLGEAVSVSGWAISSSGSPEDSVPIQNPNAQTRGPAQSCAPLPEIQNRLVTLTGPGGSGKTRLALEVARRLRTAFHGAVWFVALQDLTDARLIPDKLLDALRLPRSPHTHPIEQAEAFLSHQPSLLLLDNFEHLVTDGAPLVQSLLDQVPALTCLVTSRQRLNLAGEQEFPVAPLPVPMERPRSRANAPTNLDRSDPSELSNPSDPATLTRCPSVQLFVDRAQAARPDFQVTRTNAEAVARLCARLEGLPLALELAAARAGVLSPQQMLARLERRFELLTRAPRGTVPRHLSLWAALGWSCQLLSPELQRYFAQLSVFQGGWTLEAAEAVCGDFEPQMNTDEHGRPMNTRDCPPASSPDQCSSVSICDSLIQNPKSKIQNALDCLAQLRECSLVLAAEAGGEMRFRLLETLREYGAEQLSAREREELAGRHAGYYLALAEEADRGLRGPEREAWSVRLRAEHDNMRAALAWALAHQEAETALRLGGALAWFWCSEQYLSEGRYRLEASLGLPGAAARTAPRALALRGLGWLAWHHSDFEAAHAALRESIAICRELGDKVGLAHALTLLGWIEQESGRDLAVMRAAREESLALFREVGDLWGTARATHDLGRSACEEGDYETARRLHEEAAALFRAQGDPYSLAYPLIGLGHVAQRQGDYAAARRCFAECLAIRERYLSQSVAKANALGNLARTDWCLGDWQAALTRLEACVDLRRTGGMPKAMAWDLFWLGRVAQCAGQPERAAGPLRESLDLFRKHGNRKGEAQALIALGRLAREQQRPAAAPSLLCEGLVMALAVTDHAAVATALVEIAALLGDTGARKEWERAARLLGAAQAIRHAGTARLLPPERARHDQQIAALRAALGGAAFQAAWAAGQALTLEQVVAEAMQALGKEADPRATK